MARSIGDIALATRRGAGPSFYDVVRSINRDGIDTSKKFTEGQQKRALAGLNRMFIDLDLRGDERSRVADELVRATLRIYAAIATQRPLTTGKPLRKRSRPRRS